MSFGASPALAPDAELQHAEPTAERVLNALKTGAMPGWTLRSLPACNGFRLRSIEVRALRSALSEARSSGGAVLIVGDGVLETTAPRAVLGMARWPSCLTVVVPDKAPLATALRWRDAGAVEVLQKRELEVRLHDLVTTPFRGELKLEAWAPRSRGDRRNGERLLQMVPHLRNLKVEEWATRSGRSERTLRNDCIALFKVPPRDILWAFVEASYRAGRADERSIPDMAKSLGYFDKPNLRRAFLRRGLEFPG